jgi:molybdopterin-guanine dinucleotide biosynthesis protein A
VTPLQEFDAVLLTGGSGRRLGGADKPALQVGDRPIVARVAAAAADAGQLIVVGPAYAGVRADVVAREDPPGGGPAAALAAGIPHVRAARVAVLGGDLPFVTGAVLDDLRRAVAADDGPALALLVDDDGRDQPLCAVWRTAALRTALAGVGSGTPLRQVVAAAPAVLRRTVRVRAGSAPPWFDCDTSADLARAREWG